MRNPRYKKATGERGSYITLWFDKALTPTDAEVSAVSYTPGDRAKLFANRSLPQGSPVGVRLNLNLLKKGVALQTVHHRTHSGKVVGYDSAVTLRNAVFDVNQKARSDIASGRSNKFPMASVNGETSNLPHSKEGTEIRFNPKTDHLFTDAKTGEAVAGADEATVIGHRVYARGVRYHTPETAPAPHGGVPSNTRVRGAAAAAHASAAPQLEFDMEKALLDHVIVGHTILSHSAPGMNDGADTIRVRYDLHPSLHASHGKTIELQHSGWHADARHSHFEKSAEPPQFLPDDPEELSEYGFAMGPTDDELAEHWAAHHGRAHVAKRLRLEKSITLV